MRIVVVGAGLAAWRLISELTRSGYSGDLVVIGDEIHEPYDRPPLSKQVLRGGCEDTRLAPEGFFRESNVQLMLGAAAVGLDRAKGTVELADGAQVGYDRLVIATGVQPRRMATWPDLAGLHTLRTRDDALALRAELPSAKRALVVGAGFVGCEVASSLRFSGLEVVLVEPQAAPLAGVLGSDVGALVARLHRAEGVDLRTETGVSGFDGDGRVERATLTDGSEVLADVVVAGIGSVPATSWLAGSGIEIDDGVHADHVGQTNDPRVWAIGDVAAWQVQGVRQRVEHWTNVSEQAQALVPALLGQGSSPRPPAVPYFWSDQYGVKIQALGTPSPDAVLHLLFDDGRRFLACYERDRRLVAAVSAGMPAEAARMRGKIAAGVGIGEVLTSRSPSPNMPSNATTPPPATSTSPTP